MSKLTQVTHSQHERTVDIIRQTEHFWPYAWQSASPFPLGQTNIDTRQIHPST